VIDIFNTELTSIMRQRHATVAGITREHVLRSPV